MGVTPTGQPSFYNDPDNVAERAKYGNNLNTNQFYNAGQYEPFSPQVRNSFDNPDFLWPPNQFKDITGKDHVIQRGYMRSLITAPSATVGISGVNNRRLFFQFNPQVLVRAVQQSVGTMNPLLQDPAQLTQPVPGTASFGFELFFNREHEVAAGYNDPAFEGMALPYGSGAALTSQVGVLADILVLDTIIGQGISQDMLAYVQAFQKKITINKNNATIEEQDRLNKLGQEDKAKELVTTDAEEETQKLAKAFSANLGNSAFLNPLPFRVLFSTLFMVEGLATSVEVQFQKFNLAMVPTQCKVVINMYALYFGFANKKTFLTESLSQAAIQRQEEAAAVSPMIDVFNRGMISASVLLEGISKPNYAIFSPINLSNLLIDAEKNKIVSDVKMKVYLDYKFSNISNKPSDSEMEANRIQLEKEYSLKDLKNRTSLSVAFGNQLAEIMANTDPANFPYFSFRICIQFTGTIPKTSTPVESEIIPFSAVYGQPWFDTGSATSRIGYSSYQKKEETR